jgi:hypothetical protein
MAHFAELNNSNEVLRVVVISNEDVNANGGELSSEAEAFVASIVPHSEDGTVWKQTSYNNNFRKQYAGIGHTYDAIKNKFISPKPYPSWSLDSNDDWQAPVAYPSHTTIGSAQVTIYWDEDNQKWLGETYTGDPLVKTNYQWDATNLQWNEV